MSFAFALSPAFLVSQTRPNLAVNSWRGWILTATPSRKVFRRQTCCLAVSREPSASEDEEKLDETAMRAAEIHEVVSGLKEFKNRIIEGKELQST